MLWLPRALLMKLGWESPMPSEPSSRAGLVRGLTVQLGATLTKTARSQFGCHLLAERLALVVAVHEQRCRTQR